MTEEDKSVYARPSTRVHELDGIRGIAIAVVLLNHVQQVLLPPALLGQGLTGKAIDRTFQAGWMGVDIFFVLSGFLITGIILKGVGERQFYRGFYARRAARILPAFLLMFASVVALLPRLHAWVYAAYLLFFPNWLILAHAGVGPLNHVWSLGIEEQFYLVWPPLTRRINRERLVWIALTIAAASVFLRLCLYKAHVDIFVIYQITITRLDGLCLGAALAAAVLTPRYKAFLLSYWRRIAWVSGAALTLGYLWMHGSYYASNIRSLLIGPTALGVLTCTLIFGSVEGKLTGRLQKVFSNKILRWGGRRSYSLYLVHPPLLWAAAYELRSRGSFRVGTALAASVAVVAVSFLISEASWHLIESPSIRYGHRLTRSSDVSTVAALR